MNKSLLITMLVAAVGLTDAANPASYFSGVTPNSGYKAQTAHNPIMTQHFGADPYAMVYNGRVYVYMTYDSFRYDSDGNLTSNTYSQITQLYCISSDDMVNWTDHGALQIAGSSGAAKWAGCSWAPTACHKTINGKEKFFLYFANNANGIGVVTSDSPTGPWTDPNGQALISRSTTNCTDIPWVFDPAVLVDDDGTGYLYFGGGAPDGATGDAKNYPKSARVVKLASNMTSMDGTPITLNPPYLFEDAGANKIGDKYIYSYCTNWSCSEPGSAYIAYMTSTQPTTGFSYTGGMFKNPGAFFANSYGNNHHSMIKFGDQYYLFYHSLVLQNDMGITGGYRCTHVDKINVNESTGKIDYATGTRAGVSQLKNVDAFSKNEAETMAWMAGIDTKAGGSNQLITSIDKGDWIGVSGVDFGAGASAFTANVSSTTGNVAIKICADKVDGDVIGYLEVPNTNGKLTEVTAKLEASVTGKHDLFFVFSGSFDFDYWQFSKNSLSLTASETSIEEPASVSLTCESSASDIKTIDLLMNGKSVGTSTTAPYTAKLTDLSAGRYYFQAVMTSNSGEETKSDSVLVTVRKPQGPYNDVAQTIPGTVEAEDYDEGGEGYAYHDEDDTNSGKAYRTEEGVDVDSMSEGGFVLGWTKVGEWLEYTVDVKRSDIYNFTANVASGLNGSGFKLFLDDVAITDTVKVPNTDSWTAYTTVSGKTSKLSAGKHVLKMSILGSYCNIDKLVFSAANPVEYTFSSPADSMEVVAGSEFTVSWKASAAESGQIKLNWIDNEGNSTTLVSKKSTTDEYTTTIPTWFAGQSGHYELVYVENSEESSVAVSAFVSIVKEATGVSMVNSDNISVMPNPASTYVKVDGVVGLQSLELMCLDGRVVKTVAEATMNVSDLARGTYLLRIQSANGVTVKKVIIR